MINILMITAYNYAKPENKYADFTSRDVPG